MPVKVECESCKAPYTIDERRIPAAGLRVRCPKCTKTFVVKKPGDAPESAKTTQGVPGVGAGASLADLPAQAPPTPPQSALPPSPDSSDADLPAVAGAPDALLPSPVTRPAAPKKPVIKGTALGLGGLVPGVVAAASAQAKSAAENDLPATRAAAKPTVDDLPAARPAPPKPAPPKPAPARPAIDDLPAPKPPVDASRAKPGNIGELDLPAPAAPSRVAPKAPPAAPPRAQAKTVTGFDDLPAPAATRADLPAFAKKSVDPTTKPDIPAQRAAAAKNTKMEFGEIDLPAVQPAGLPSARAASPQQFGEIDLPAVQPAGLPSPRGASPQQFGEIDLPAVQPVGLPSARGASPQQFGEIDLPSVQHAGLPAVSKPGVRDLPSPRGASTQGFGEIDLPSVTPGGGHLPAVRGPGADLPDLSPAGAHLPAVAAPGANLPVVAPAAANLPARRAADDFGMREPSVAMPAPSDFGGDFGGGGGHEFAVAQTMVGPGVQTSGASDASGFGELELPGPGGSGVGDPWGTPAPDLGLRSNTARGFGEIDLGGDLGTSPRAATGVEASAVNAPSLGGSDFGELELPGPTPSIGASPSADTFGGNAGGLSFDSFAPPPPQPSPIGTEASLVSKIDSRATGGMGFGEVDLGGGTNDDALEFGAIPEEKRVDGVAPVAYDAPISKPRTDKAEAPAAPEQEKKPSKAGRIVAVFFAFAVVGGGLLEFDERLGAFGRRAISDKLNADKYAGMLTTAVKRTRDGLGDDALVRANDAVNELQKDVAVAPRYSPIIAYAAYAQFAHELRFGKDPQRDSLARSALGKLKDAGSERTLAEATRDVVAGQLPAARGALKSLTAADAKNVDAWVTLGELELRDKKPKDALAAFDLAVKAKDDARTRYGLMRAYDASGEFDKAKAEASTIAAKYPNHAGARLLLAKYAWERDKDEKEAMKWLSDLEKPTVLAGAAINEQVDAMTLRGNIHLDRGRVSSAAKAFNDAIAAAKGNPVPGPRLGLGEVHLANGLFPNAISEFNLASQAAPDAALPKIGVARAYLKQEKPTEAKAQLANLKDPLLAGEIGFWLGQAEEKLTPERPSDAIKIYEAAITAQPSEAKPYIALANLHTKIGKMDEADATLAQAAKNVPPSERLHLGIGELRFRQERYKDALEQFNKALELQPSNLEALYSKGKTLLRMGEREKLDEGKKVLDLVKEKDDKYPGLALEYGLYFQKTDQLEEALKQYQTALQRDPKDIDIRLSVARAQVEAHIKDAEASLREILAACGSSASPEVCQTEANHYLGRAILDRGEAAAAKPFLEAAVTKGDNNAQYHLYYGWALVEQTALIDAEKEIVRALELDKSLGLAHWLRGEIDAKSGKYVEAIESCKRALALSPTLSGAHATIAFANKQLNNEEAALAAYATAIKSDPSSPRAAWWRYQFADIQFHRGTVGRAVNELRDAIKQAKTFVAAPLWLPKAHFYLAEALRKSDRAEALKAYREYLEKSVGSTDPARKEAQAAVNELAGKP